MTIYGRGLKGRATEWRPRGYCDTARGAQERAHTLRLARRLEDMASRGCRDRNYMNSPSALEELAEAVAHYANVCDLQSFRAVQATNLARGIVGYRGKKGTAICEGVQLPLRARRG